MVIEVVSEVGSLGFEVGFVVGLGPCLKYTFSLLPRNIFGTAYISCFYEYS